VKFAASRTAIAALALVALGTAVSACGDDDDSSSDATTPVVPAATEAPAATQAPAATEAPTATEAPAATEAPGATEAPAAGGETVMTAESDLGTILVDGEGHTLYMFAPDSQGPSTCTGDCLGAWPALLGPATAGEGVDESLLGTAPRPDDGTEQVTYDGWPLYYFAQDAAPGDAFGQAVNDVWYVVDPTGAPVGMAASTETTAADDGY
jgi:predicted lipoprotein with Yx(FWY)xxD motif